MATALRLPDYRYESVTSKPVREGVCLSRAVFRSILPHRTPAGGGAKWIAILETEAAGGFNTGHVMWCQ
jgi:hypothetical protein